MERDLWSIMSKPSDYKICTTCGAINWYENEECSNMFCTGEYPKFDSELESVKSAVNTELDYWMETEGYNFSEAQDVIVTV